ncbi:hypothetical protein [Bdellovibrio sp. HCB209]|uniref:hypothetical protein n=1 Tax=Bdellovibrio sp. HCB209 TaxID=3394354 RepID=UPI0039B5F397
MPARPQKSSACRQRVLKLDTGLRLAMAFLLPLIASVSAQARIVACDDVFASAIRDERAPYYDIAMDRAMTKSVREFSDKDGLSERDIQYLIEKVYNQTEGKATRVSDYIFLTPQERTFNTLTRMVGEKVTHQGIVAVFKEQGILLDESTLISKFRTFNRAPMTNMASAAFATSALLKGRPPILLPEFFFKIKTEDMTVLLMRGLDSKEGQAIVKKYQNSQEAFRAYELFNRYYTRVALTVVFAVLYEKGDDFFKEKHDSVLADLWAKILEELSLNKGKSA